jgi:hypothetical protein
MVVKSQLTQNNKNNQRIISQLTQNIIKNQPRYDTRQMRIKNIKEKLRKFGKPGQTMINHLVKRNSEFTNTNIKEKLRKFGKPGQTMINHLVKRNSEFNNTKIKELYNQTTVTGMVNVIKRVLKFENVKNKPNNNSNSGSNSSKSSPRNIPTRSRS